METFQVVTEADLVKANLFFRSRLNQKTGCWEWIGPKDAAGYGFMGPKEARRKDGHRKAGKNSRSFRVHRISYEVYKGAIPDGAVICHSCDNPSCINPDHLRAGSMKENMADREARGRRDVRGEQIGTSKLTRDQVLAIKESDLGLKALAEQYGVKPTHIWRIQTGKSWSHLDKSVKGYQET